MRFHLGRFYHIYNRGNNKQRLFLRRENYIYFREKIRKYICPHADLLAWTLMPNHFHLLVRATKETMEIARYNPFYMDRLTDGIRLLLSSYTRGFHEQERTTGNLFQQKTKVKAIDPVDLEYAKTAFHYIHQNAYRAGLVSKPELWSFSSLPEYLELIESGNVTDALSKGSLGLELLDLDPSSIRSQAVRFMPETQVRNIFVSNQFDYFDHLRAVANGRSAA